MSAPDDVVVLLDCDNTLLDNDLVQLDLRAHLDREFGVEHSARYWSILEALRTEVGYVDYLGALQRYRRQAAWEPRLLLMSSFLIDYDFARRLYPGALDALRHLRSVGLTVILSDGDVVFQPRKIQRSGLWDAVEGRVVVTIHKEQSMEIVAEMFPARHYVVVDDKLRILAAMKDVWKERATTVFVRQGHYAHDLKSLAGLPAADLTVERIGELAYLNPSAVPGALRADPPRPRER